MFATIAEKSYDPENCMQIANSALFTSALQSIACRAEKTGLRLNLNVVSINVNALVINANVLLGIVDDKKS